MKFSNSIKKATVAVIALASVGAMTSAANASRYCDREARDYADHRAGGGGEDALRGGLLGAIGGAILGGAIDGGRGAGRGALIGGGVGVVGGAVHGSAAWKRAYNRSYRKCVNAQRTRHRNNARPAKVRRARARPAAWSDEWYQYCAERYRSFNPDTGYYKTYSGRFRLCK